MGGVEVGRVRGGGGRGEGWRWRGWDGMGGVEVERVGGVGVRMAFILVYIHPVLHTDNVTRWAKLSFQNVRGGKLYTMF